MEAGWGVGGHAGGWGEGEVGCDCRSICYRGKAEVCMAAHDDKDMNLDFHKINSFYNLEFDDFAHIFVSVYNGLFYEKSMVVPFLIFFRKKKDKIGM